jgi:hypothetical protein
MAYNKSFHPSFSVGQLLGLQAIDSRNYTSIHIIIANTYIRLLPALLKPGLHSREPKITSTKLKVEMASAPEARNQVEISAYREYVCS